MAVLRALIAVLPVSASMAHADPLPSWNQTGAKAAIIEFVDAVVEPGSDRYVDPAERIAVFDNDGTLWAEQPFYFQIAFALDRFRQMAARDPSIGEKYPTLKAVVDGDGQALFSGGHEDAFDLLAITHSGISTEEFRDGVATWLKSANHPDTGKLYADMVYQPMLELLSYLRESGFKTYIVSGGGIDFIRVFSQDAYRIPPEQIVGSSVRAEFELTDKGARTIKLAELFFFDDNEGKPVAINHHIGRRPLIAVGNSDGDLQMLQYTTRGTEQGLAIIVHHTDADREWAYDRDAKVGHLDKALDEARAHGWTVVDMASDWRIVFPWEVQ